MAEQAATTWTYYHPDAPGSVRQLSDSTGTLTLGQSYEPYGDKLTTQGTGSSNYGFTGEWMDGTGLVNLRARYLYTSVGRFTSKDTFSGIHEFPQTLNRYSYVNGNVINATDPTGHLCFYGQNVWPLGKEPCTTEEIEYWNNYFSEVGGRTAQYAEGVAARSEEVGLHPIVGLGAETIIMASATSFEAEFFQNPQRQSDIIFGGHGNWAERVLASCSVWDSTGQVVVEFLLAPSILASMYDEIFEQAVDNVLLPPGSQRLRTDGIRYTQSYYSNVGYSDLGERYYVSENTKWLSNNPGRDLASDPIRIFIKQSYMDGWGKKTRGGFTGDPRNLVNGLIYTLDTRRLKAYKDAGREFIPIIWADLDDVRKLRWHFTTLNKGIDISLR